MLDSSGTLIHFLMDPKGSERLQTPLILILTKKDDFLAIGQPKKPWSKTLNGRLPPKTSSYSAQTSAEPVSEHSRHFIF